MNLMPQQNHPKKSLTKDRRGELKMYKFFARLIAIALAGTILTFAYMGGARGAIPGQPAFVQAFCMQIEDARKVLKGLNSNDKNVMVEIFADINVQCYWLEGNVMPVKYVEKVETLGNYELWIVEDINGTNIYSWNMLPGQGT